MSEKMLPTLGAKPMNLAQAYRYGQKMANDCHADVVIFRTKADHDVNILHYDVAFSVPDFAVRVDVVSPGSKSPVLEESKELNEADRGIQEDGDEIVAA